MAALPGSRDFWAVVAQVPAVAMSRLDVGGSNAITTTALHCLWTDQRGRREPR